MIADVPDGIFVSPVTGEEVGALLREFRREIMPP
jgi:hypothetical protein